MTRSSADVPQNNCRIERRLFGAKEAHNNVNGGRRYCRPGDHERMRDGKRKCATNSQPVRIVRNDSEGLGLTRSQVPNTRIGDEIGSSGRCKDRRQVKPGEEEGEICESAVM